MLFLVKVFIPSVIIRFVCGLSRRRRLHAEFLIAQPSESMIILPFPHLAHGDPTKPPSLATSIVMAVPVPLPFLLSYRLAEELGFSA
ncbi:MAG TPA: hypothetical protein VNP04_29930 [Alphaproteobacteria bacterium]|nr:hypothetical protein [Alphaproteobacteria bacterium]